MRTIKFRAWHKTLRVLLTVYTIDQATAGNTDQYYPHCRGFYGEHGEKQVVFHFDEVIWLQFTGLLDKNGTEVYEGDIVQEFTMYPGAPISMIWDNESLSWKGKIHGTREIRVDKKGYEFEVIGNIYENRNLLV